MDPSHSSDARPMIELRERMDSWPSPKPNPDQVPKVGV